MNYLKRNDGFTLMELLIVIAILGILSAIVMYQFSSYQQKSYDAQAHSDLRNAVTAEEAYYASAQTYKSGTDNGPGNSRFLEGLRLSPTVALEMVANGSTFSGTAKSSRGSRTLSYDSATGTIQ